MVDPQIDGETQAAAKNRSKAEPAGAPAQASVKTRTAQLRRGP